MDKMSRLYTDCIDVFYQCASGLLPWQEAARVSRAFVGTDFVNLNVVNVHHQTQAVHAAGLTEAQTEHYLKNWAPSDPLPLYALKQPPMVAYTHEDVLPRELDWRGTEVTQVFYEPAGMYFHAGGHLDLGNGRLAILATHRDRVSGAFGPAEKRRIEMLLPHLQRAMTLAVRLDAYAAKATTVAGLLTQCDGAVLLCDHLGYPAELSADANRYLNSTIGALRLRNGRLEAKEPGAKARLQHLLRYPKHSEQHGTPTLLTRDRAGETVECSVLDAGRTVAGNDMRLVIVRRTKEACSVDANYLRYRLGLTPVESQVLRRLMLGDSINDIADYRGTTVETTRSCIKALLRKLECHSQAQLVGKGWRVMPTLR